MPLILRNFGEVKRVTPAGGETVTLLDRPCVVVVDTGLLLSLTIDLGNPAQVERLDGEAFIISFRGAVTLLNWESHTFNQTDLPTTVLAGTRMLIVLMLSTNTWYRII